MMGQGQGHGEPSSRVEDAGAQAPPAARTYDVFIVHAADDEAFVQGYLVPSLGLTPDRVLVPRALEPGRFVLGEIERGVCASRVTVVVLSRAYLHDHWAVFGEQIAAFASLARERDAVFLPVLRDDCELPLHVQALVALDFRNAAPSRWQAEVERLRSFLGAASTTLPGLPCPYPGMRPFQQADAGQFFGRDVEIERIVRRLRRGEREIYVIGASGSGKSSLIAAGLLPRLALGVDGLPRFEVRSVRPCEHPVDRLAAAIGGDVAAPGAAPGAMIEALLADPAAVLLLVVDQLEELFASASEEQRARFFAAIRALRGAPRCALVFTLRADFYGAFMESPLWTDRDGAISRVDLGPLSSQELRMVIERPARNAGVHLEPELVSRLLDDAAREPGALPLLQETLFRLWGKRRQRLLALADYHAMSDGQRSGLAFAVKEHADDVVSGL
ncbi:MAG TPA: TIR domain-containing protein, partial [Kofleriaceae bacterium]|nr:TIR domain-containing protein [Kofleriaceae bacterium]